jgi:outer membrane protein assembly factor BamB
VRRGAHKTLRAATAACAIGAWLPAAATAQLPSLPPAPGSPPPEQQPPPPQQQPPPQHNPPPPAPGTPAGGAADDMVSYFGNPQHTNATETEPVFGPLAIQWTKRFRGPTNHPLIVGGRVLVNVSNSGQDPYGSQIVVLDARTGRELWRQPTPGVYFSAPIAVDSGRVVSVNQDGVARGFALEDGRPLWSTQVSSRATVPVAAGGVAYFGGTAVDDATGKVLWRAQTGVSSEAPLIDAQRLYMTDGCGSAVAISRASGKVLWERRREDCSEDESPGMLFGGRLFTTSDGGWTYDPATGADRPVSAPGGPQAAAGGLGFQDGPFGFSIDSGAPRWRFKKSTSDDTHDFAAWRPLVVGHDLYARTGTTTLLAFDREGGGLRGGIALPFEDYDSVGGIISGMAAGSGVLVATGGVRLTAYRSLLRPAPGGIDAAVTINDVVVGRRGEVAGAAGRTLRESKPRLRLEADPFPYGRFHRAGRSPAVNADGTTFFHPRPSRNTRYRLRAKGVPKATRPVTLFAYPRARAGRPHFLGGRRFRMSVRLSGRSDFRVGGRRLVLYLGKPFKDRYLRLGSARLRRSGRRAAVAVVTFNAPSSTDESDTLAWCMPHVRAWGRRDALNRHCGARRVRARF